MDTMKSYIKIYGPPVLDAIQALEKMAMDMPKVCIMSPIITTVLPSLAFGQQRHEGITAMTPGGVFDYFSEYGEITVERCDTIISKKGEELGEYDFFFEWFKNPDMDELKQLIGEVDETLKPLGVRYTITTK